MPAPDPKVRASLLERAGVVLLLLAALLPRARDLRGPFDREFEGFQGAFFAICAVNYERLGFDAFGGYPVQSIELPGIEEGSSDPAGWYTYENHPPLIPWLVWASLAAAGPEGWDEAWREHRPPPAGTETVMRLPFLAMQCLGLLAFWWAIRTWGGAQLAMLSLALMAVSPISAVYGTLVNYESPTLLTGMVAYGFYARWLRSGSRRDLAGVGLGFFVGGCVTFMPLLLAPPLVLHALVARGWRRAVAAGIASGFVGLVPLLVHGRFAASALSGIGRTATAFSERPKLLLAPLFDGSAPFTTWIGLQWSRIAEYFGWPVLLLACAGLVLALAGLARRFRGSDSDPDPADLPLALPLAFGGFLTLLAFYRHTYDEQEFFLLYAKHGILGLAAFGLNALARPLLRLRGGIAPLVVVTSSIAAFGVIQLGQFRNAWRAPGPNDDPPGLLGPELPLPDTAGRRIAEVLPPGAVGLYPGALGFTRSTPYYAWRELFPISPDTIELSLAQIAAAGEAGADVYWLQPLTPPSAAVAETAAMRTTLETLVPEVFEREPAARTESWEAWLLRR